MAGQKESRDISHRIRPAFDSSFQKALYKGTMDIGKHHLSGLLFVKKFSDTSFRFVFTNEIGMKFLDLEFSSAKMTAHFIFPGMDRKSLMRILDLDFRMLFFPLHGIREVLPVDALESGQEGYRIKSGNGTWILGVDSECRIRSVASKGRIIGRTEIGTEPGDGSSPEHFDIANPAIRLAIVMTLTGK